MKLYKILLVSLICTNLIIPAQAQDRFFSAPGAEIGVYYYPEHWPEDQWERDIRRIAELGFEFVHYAEFAWARLEPTEGEYRFEWLDKVVDLADQNGLKVIMCTPTPCIPAWLAEKHPEVLKMNANGQRVYHNGSRVTASLADPVYQQYAEKIVNQLVERYGDDQRIWGWQIGNEPHIAGAYDYSPSAELAFREWLKGKYKTIDRLNQAWGASFWSYSFNDFDQVRIPNPEISGVNPHALLDFQRYTSQEIANDLNRQADWLRAGTDPSQWITTNYAYYKFLPNVDPFLTREHLDFSAHTMYLTSNFLNHSGDSLFHRLGSGMELSFSQEMAESTHGYTGIMELQPGQINWGRFNAMPLPGAVRMWVWHAFALGDEFICTYRFRQPLFGGEQTHHGIMTTDGVTVNRGGEEFVQAMNEIAEAEKELNVDKVPEYLQRIKTGFLWDFDNILDMENHKHHEDWDSWQHMYTYYQALKRMAAPVTFIQEDHKFDPTDYPFIVAPAYQIMPRELITKLEAYVKAGGNLVLSTRAGLKNADGHLWEAKIQEPIWDLIGGEIQFYDHLPAQYPGNISFGDENYPWHIWGEVVESGTGTETWAEYADQFYQGSSSVTHRSLGKGSVTFVGPWSDDRNFEFEVLRKLYAKMTDQSVENLPPYVFREFREGLWIMVNYTNKVYRQNLTDGDTVVQGNPEGEIEPGGVLVWKTN